MIKIVATMAMAMAVAACATDEAQTTSSLDQDVTSQTCTPTYDPAPPPKGGYLFCTVHAFNGATYFVHSSEADCVCGPVLNHELCVENNYPEDLVYCNHDPHGGGGGGGTGGTSGDPCSALGPSCYQEASGRCNCAHSI